jgi:hypothetical protein
MEIFDIGPSRADAIYKIQIQTIDSPTKMVQFLLEEAHG